MRVSCSWARCPETGRIAKAGVVRPRVLVALGATAARALLGAGFRISRRHGQFVESALAPT